MAPIPKRGVVAVTGAAGFLGGWVVQRAAGARLPGAGLRAQRRRCRRAPASSRPCPATPPAGSPCTAPTSTRPGCFDEIFKGCHGVAHVSHVSDYDDQDYVRRTCDHIIASVNGSGSVSARRGHLAASPR